MSEFNCVVCNYNTNECSKYNRHILSDKHIKNMKTIYICEKCNYSTINKVNYQRHLTTKKHLNINSIQFNSFIPIQDVIDKVKDGVKQEVEKIHNKKTEELLNEIQKLKELNERNTNKINDTNNKNTQKIVKEARIIKRSILTILNTHFKDSPSIDYIKQIPFIKELEKEYNAKVNDSSDILFIRIFQDYEKKKLIKTLSDLILKFVKKDDHQIQSIFNIDSSRANFATKIDDFWMNDKKGMQLRKYTINKVIHYTIDVLEVFRLRLVKIRNENIIDKSIDKNDYLMKYQYLLLELVSFLNHHSTHTKIVLQLAPNLRYEEYLMLLYE